jgi:hypothetical protein
MRYQRFIKESIYTGLILWGLSHLGQAMNLTKEEERLERSLNRWTILSIENEEKTIRISSAHSRLQLPEKEVEKQFKKDLAVVSQVLKDFKKITSHKSNFSILRNVKTFGFVFLYYSSIKDFPELTIENLVNQATILYGKALNSVETKDSLNVEEKERILRLVISQLFKRFDNVFSNLQKKGIFDHKSSNLDGLGFRFPLVESAENIIPGLNFRNMSKLFDEFQDALNDKHEFSVKFQKYLEKNYQPSEQVNALLQAPWKRMVQLAQHLSQLKQNSPNFYQKQGEKFLSALNDQLACYLAAANKFLFEGTLLATELIEQEN